MKELSLKMRLSLISIIMVVVVGSDQWTKILAKKYLRFAEPKVYLNNFFRLQYAENKGAFLSLGADMSDEMRFWIFTVAVLIGLLGGFYLLFKKENTLFFNFGLSLILSGGVGNLIDRASEGRVVDFMNMGFGNVLRTGVFNIADIAISAGAIILIIDEIKNKKNENEEKPAVDQAISKGDSLE